MVRYLLNQKLKSITTLSTFILKIQLKIIKLVEEITFIYLNSLYLNKD
jgi:hypothetical protein